MDQNTLILLGIFFSIPILAFVWKVCSFLVGFFVSDGPKKQWWTLGVVILIVLLLGILAR